MRNLWSVGEYKELLNFVQGNFNKLEWKDIVTLMSLRFGRTEHAIKTALISFNQVNQGLESSNKKGDKIGFCYGKNIEEAFNIVSENSNFSKSKWTYILTQNLINQNPSSHMVGYKTKQDENINTKRNFNSPED